MRLALLLAASLVACAPLVGADLDGYALAPPAPVTEPEGSETVPPPDGSDAATETKDAAKPDGGTQACEGKALACTAFGKQGECTAQKGCTWTPQTCTGEATGCATTNPNVCYARQPACTFDFDLRECLPAPNWCKTTDAVTCGQREGCSSVGGCGGSATTCDGLANAVCTAQRGCALVTK